MSIHMTISDGRWRTCADKVWPERCQGCGYRGASLAQTDPSGKYTGLHCSQCAPELFPAPASVFDCG
jgi:hypothetical protein